jgi:hypothetical protein
MKATIYTLIFIILLPLNASAQNMWRGLVVAPEHRCSPYDKKKQYPYPQSVEDEITRLMGGVVYGPYTGRYFESDRETDIEHIVSTSSGHNSGLCSASAQTRKSFATDPLNLTLAAPEVNRCGVGGKCGFDAAEWLPEKNKCWFANRVVEIKRKYSLTIDIEEARSLESVISNCDSTDMIFYSEATLYEQDAATSLPVKNTKESALDLYDDNKNGRITCSEAKGHGITPVHAGHPAYLFMRDANNDGIVCG